MNALKDRSRALYKRMSLREKPLLTLRARHTLYGRTTGSTACLSGMHNANSLNCYKLNSNGSTVATY